MKKKIWLIMATAAVLAAIAISIFQRTKPKENSYSIYETPYTLDTGYSFTSIQVCGMGDKKLEEKVNASLNQYFYLLENWQFYPEYVRETGPIIRCQSDRYLSVQYVFDHYTALYQYWHLCVTVDMQSGEAVFLDDLVELDDDFAETIKHGSVLNVKTAYQMTVEEATELVNEDFAEQNAEYILDYFKDFTRDYMSGEYYYQKYGLKHDWKTYTLCHYFYVEEGKICVKSLSSSTEEGMVYEINLEDIEEHLKVPMW